jgi:parallel beta-helix repeat protein
MLPGGHQLQGDPSVPRDAIVLQAGPGWINNAGDGVVNDDGFGGPVARVHHFTVDGAGISTGGIGARRLLVDDMVVRGGKCWGVAVAGDLMTVQNSWIHRNGADPTCFGAPGAGIYMVTQHVSGRPSVYAPVVVGNRISDNIGPGLDIASVWSGTLSNNVIVNNTSWAGVSLFGSRWTISDNVVRHPATREGQPYLSSCRAGPIGVGSAAIFLCQTNDFFNNVTTANNVVNNHVSSWYGVLVVGNDGAQPYYTPRNNSIRNNNAFGSLHGFADDFRPGQWFSDINTWSGNRPTHF